MANTTIENIIPHVTDNPTKVEIKSSTVKPVNVITPSLSNISNPTKVPDTKARKYFIRLTEIRPTIVLDELSLPSAKQSSFDPAHNAEDELSVEIPLIKINGYIFNREEIYGMTIDCTEFLPKITLTVVFEDQLFLAKHMVTDGDIISVSIRNVSNVIKMLRNDYVITGVYVMENMTERKNPVVMTLYGELFIPGLKSHVNDFSFEGTSMEALKDFAKRYGLGFATNEDNTNDKQIWLKANIAGDIYVNNIIRRAWKDEESFFDGWIDIYYNLNFVNVNKQLISSEEELDITALSSNIDKNWNFGTLVSPDNTTIAIKLFSNFTQLRNSAFYIRTWKPINRASSITFQVGTSMVCEMFEHNKNIYENPKTEDNKNYWAIKKEPTYDKSKLNSMMILRGRNKFDPSINKTDLKLANNSYLALYEKMPWMGIQYTISNPDDNNLNWDGNHHANYQLARVQNLINNKELDKLNVHIDVDGHNLTVIRGDKVPVLLLKKDVFENIKIDPDRGLTGREMADLFYSGWYYVKGFTLNWHSMDKTSVISSFTHTFILTRREWPPPVFVEPINSVIALNTTEPQNIK